MQVIWMDVLRMLHAEAPIAPTILLGCVQIRASVTASVAVGCSCAQPARTENMTSAKVENERIKDSCV